MRTWIERTTTINGWRFRRVSAAYIDIFPPGSRTAVDAINVYDYEASKPRIDNSAKAHRHEAEEWMQDHEYELDDYASIAGL